MGAGPDQPVPTDVVARKVKLAFVFCGPRSSQLQLVAWIAGVISRSLRLVVFMFFWALGCRSRGVQKEYLHPPALAGVIPKV